MPAGRENLSRYLLGGAVAAFFSVLVALGGFLYRLGSVVDQHEKVLARIERQASEWYPRADALRDEEERQQSIVAVYGRLRELEGAHNALRELLGGENIGDLKARVAHLEGRMTGRGTLP